jgi:endogenous inhibitor of DNA gyrase (YacG/DUF329 family)
MIVQCEICGKEIQICGISSHIRLSHSITLKEYYDSYLKSADEGKCALCGKDTKFNGYVKGYLKYCSSKCANSDTNGNLQKQLRSEETKAKRTSTVKEKYGVSNVLKSPIVKQKIIQTNLSKYGVSNVFANKDIQERIKQTNISRYNAENPFASESIKEKIRQSLLQKYGVSHPMYSDEIKQKMMTTNLERYGVSNTLQLEKVYSDECWSKRTNTLRKNDKRSKMEKYFLLLLEAYNISSYIEEYKDSRYPYFCDFYLPHLDLFIEINNHPSHGGHWFDSNNKVDLDKLGEWKSKQSSSYYQRAISIWTVEDVQKRLCAERNNINYVVLWNKEDIDNWFNDNLPIRKDWLL